jgi:hypothetical protein
LVLALDARRRTELDHLVADLPTRQPVRRRFQLLYQRLVVEINQVLPAWIVRPSVPAMSELALPPVPGKYVIGRADGVDLCLDDISVSRRHALIAHLDGGWVITDLGSRNGTWLNGWRLPGPAPIGPGDRLDLGSCRFVVVDKSAADLSVSR